MCVGSSSKGIFLPTAVNDGIFLGWRKEQRPGALSLLCFLSLKSHFIMREVEVTFPLQQLPVISAEVCHAHAEL